MVVPSASGYNSCKKRVAESEKIAQASDIPATALKASRQAWVSGV